MQLVLKDMVFFHVNTNSDVGRKLRDRFSINFTPQFLVTNAAVERVALIIGYSGPEDWILDMNKVIADPITLAQRKIRCEKKPNAWDCIVLGRVADGSGQSIEAVKFWLCL